MLDGSADLATYVTESIIVHFGREVNHEMDRDEYLANDLPYLS